MNSKLRIWGVFFALLLAFGACFAQKKGNLKAYETHREGKPQMLYGQVKSIKEVFQYSPPEVQLDTNIYAYDYDKQGRVLEYKFLDLNIGEGEMEQYEYNVGGLRVRSWVFAIDTTSVRQGNYNTDTIRRNDYKYDERGLLLEQRVWYKDNEIPYRYFYNDKGQLERRVCYEDEVLLHIKHYVYNEAGQLEQTRNGEDEKNATHYKYNTQGQLIEKDLGGVNKWVYEYNPKGFLATETYYSDNKKVSTATHIYTYDEQGNWISCETYIEKPGKGKKLDEISTREITYY